MWSEDRGNANSRAGIRIRWLTSAFPSFWASKDIHNTSPNNPNKNPTHNTHNQKVSQLVLHSSKAVHETTTKVTMWRWGPSPDPGLSPRVEVGGGDACCLLDLLGVGEVLAGERLAAEEAPPAFLQVEPTGARRDGHRMDPRMDRQPLLDGPTGVAGEIVRDQGELALRIGVLKRGEEREVADRVACGGGAGAVKGSSCPSRTRKAP